MCLHRLYISYYVLELLHVEALQVYLQILNPLIRIYLNILLTLNGILITD